MTISIAGGNAISWNIVNRNVSSDVSLKQKLVRKVAVLAKHLIHFPAETLHLQVVLEKLVKKELYNVSLTLRIPSNILHAEKSSRDLIEAIDSAIAALLREVKSLKAELRGDYRWKREAYRARLRADEALFFSEPMAAGPQTHADMVSELLRVHNNQLLAHVRREVRIAELAGDLPRGMVDPRDIVDEAAGTCLAHADSKPVELTYELWFYQLIRQELARRCAEFNQERSLSAKPPTGRDQTAGEDEGYDAERPLDLITRELEPEEDLPEERIADPSIVPPDSMISGQEVLKMLQDQVYHWPAQEREVFELYYLVGLDADEIGKIQSRTSKEIEALIGKIQLQLRDFLRETAQ
jgi:DNA-directed RNA polymerase specialized sigma24 family protein/ribosome-associated translation inhibitor RaiA